MQVNIAAQSEYAAPAQEPDLPDVLILPGLNNSGPEHWQSHWETLPGFRRLDFGSWSEPRLHDWVLALDREVRASTRPVVLAAHSLGCLAAAWWASLFWNEALEGKVRGALLVAPPDVDALNAIAGVRDFRPTPHVRFPFPSLLIASRNDPYASYSRSRDMAVLWGSGLVDGGRSGHLNAESGLWEWPAGLRILATLSGHDPNRLVMQLGLKAAFA